MEIIVEERPWQPPFRYRDNDLAPLTVGYEETELRERLRGLRAKWDPDTRVWLVPYGKIKGTELEKRIFDEDLAGKKKV